MKIQYLDLNRLGGPDIEYTISVEDARGIPAPEWGELGVIAEAVQKQGLVVTSYKAIAAGICLVGVLSYLAGAVIHTRDQAKILPAEQTISKLEETVSYSNTR